MWVFVVAFYCHLLAHGTHLVADWALHTLRCFPSCSSEGSPCACSSGSWIACLRHHLWSSFHASDIFSSGFFPFSLAEVFSQIWSLLSSGTFIVTDFLFLGSRITADGACSHEIKGYLLFGRRAVTILGSILKSRDFASKGPSSQSSDFSCSYVWM